MQHIEEAGVHSGDSMAVLPPYLLSMNQLEDIKEYTRLLAKALKVKGLINIEFAILFDTLYVLEVNPRASRTIPFVSKATGNPIAKVAVKVMAGNPWSSSTSPLMIGLRMSRSRNRFSPLNGLTRPTYTCVRKCDPPGRSWGLPRPSRGCHEGLSIQRYYRTGIRHGFSECQRNDKPRIVPIAAGLQKMHYNLVATKGTATYIADRGIAVTEVLKASEGRPNVVDDIKNRSIDLIINTPLGQRARSDEFAIGWAATKYRVPVITTLSAAEAIVRGLKMMRSSP